MMTFLVLLLPSHLVHLHSNKTLYVHRHLSSVKSERFSKLLKSILEIENLFNNNKLDIEFIVTKSQKINILQVRPIVNKNTLRKMIIC